MCELEKYGTTRVDPCLIDEINSLKTPEWNKKFMSIMSCCGHGKYPKTLIVKNRGSGSVFEWFTSINLSKSNRAKKRCGYYTKDADGFYFIPEVSANDA